MKIGWLKYTGAMEIGHHLLHTTGTADIRTGLFKSLLSLGHELYLYSPITRETVKYFNTPDGKFFKERVKLQLTEKIEDKIDILIVESGTTNTSFSTMYRGQKISSVAYSNKIISNYKGIVFYLQIDLDLYFAFFPEYYSLNYVKDYLSYGNFASLVKDKTWVVLSPAKKLDMVRDRFDLVRGQYPEMEASGNLKFERFEFHYCCNHDWDIYKIKKKYENVITYVGGERSRMAKTRKYYESVAKDIPVRIWGKWKEDSKKKLPNILWGGVLGKGEPRDAYNKSWASIIIGDVNYEKAQIVSGRLFEVVTAKTLPLIDIDLVPTTVSDIFSKDLLDIIVVSNEDDIRYAHKNIQGDLRRDVIRECVSQMKKFTPDTSSHDLISLVKKYEDVPYDKKTLKRQIQIFEDSQDKRIETLEFSRLFYDSFLNRYYEVNSNGGYLLNENIKRLDFVKAPICFRCGDSLEKAGNIFASRMLCNTCKTDPKHFEKVLEKNLDKWSKFIKVVKNK